jgi:hypothetical protein
MNLCVLMRSEMMKFSKQHVETVVCNGIRIKFYAKIASKNVHIEMLNGKSYNKHNVEYLY